MLLIIPLQFTDILSVSECREYASHMCTQNMLNHNWSTSVLVLPVMAYPVMKWSLMAHPVMTNPEIMHTISPSTYICSNFPPLTLSTHSMGVLCPPSVIMPGIMCTATQTVWFLPSNIWR